MPYRPMRALQLGHPRAFLPSASQRPSGPARFPKPSVGLARKEHNNTHGAPALCAQGGENNDRGGYLRCNSGGGGSTPSIHHRPLPHPPPSSTHSGPRELLVLLLDLSASPDSGQFFRPFPTASPEDPSLTTTSELLSPLSQLALPDSGSAGLDRQSGL
ncbi:hypothetical protein CFIO01_13617 [Colletotrichum fioriniae PJ7]|uniref:Uncharacterized protein n=1 Tax=Colletotrichum fioriniae PJ7 TaxID=1445577 RepID=A0A010RBD1_9PEZI|nr:hypothetical protein CFIO01_13617 [Colletotrichum fioriniae PJ7]